MIQSPQNKPEEIVNADLIVGVLGASSKLHMQGQKTPGKPGKLVTKSTVKRLPMIN